MVATVEGVYYVNLIEKFYSLLAGSANGKVVFMKCVAGFMITSHDNGRLKVWNIDTA